MTDNLIGGVVTVATAIVGVAVLAVLVSKNAQTGTVLTSAGSAFSSALTAAEEPVSGNSFGFGNGVSGVASSL